MAGYTPARADLRVTTKTVTFEPDRRGTDWTRAVALLTYEQGVEAFRVTNRISGGDRT
jgi:hypothetical protein